MTALARIPRKRLLPAAALAAAALVLPAVLLASGRTQAGQDLRDSYLPHAAVLREAARSGGSLPLWNFLEFGGTPFLGNLVDGLFYPPNLLVVLLPFPRIFDVLTALHLLLAAVGLYRLARSYRLGRDSAALAGCAYALSFTLFSRVAAGHYGMIVPLSHAPLLLLLVRKLIRDPRPSRTVLLALEAACIVAGGHPPFVYQLALLAVAFAGIELAAAPAPQRRRAALFLAAAGAGTLLLAAVHLLPSAEVRRFATRGSISAAELYPDNPPDFSFLPRDAVSFWIPFYPRSDYLGPNFWVHFWHEKAVYLGLIPLALALFAIATGRRHPAVILFAAAAALALADALSRTLPVHRILLALLPGYDMFRIPGRSVWAAGLSGCFLAGIGWDRWRRTDLPERVRLRFAAGVAGAGVLVAVLVAVKFGVHAELGAYLATLAAAAGLLAVSGRLGSRAALAVLLFTGIEVGVQDALVVPTAAPETLIPVPWYREAMGPDPAAYRVLNLSADNRGYQPAMFGIRMMHGRGYPLLGATSRLYGTAWQDEVPRSFDGLGAGKILRDPGVLDLLNVGWMLEEGAAREPGLVEVARHGATVLYRRPSARPYASLGEATRGVDTIRVRARAPAAERLVVSESWMPGWIAMVDGRPAEVTPFEGALLSVELPAGDHEVEFRYRPASYRLGRAVSLGALVIGIGVLVAFRRRGGTAPATSCTSRRP